MTADLIGATHTQHEDPTGDAASAGASHLSVGLAAAQIIAAHALSHASARGQAKDQRATAVAEQAPKQGLTPFQTAQGAYAPMMGRDRGHTASSQVALDAWQAASPWRKDYREADKAATRAESRLRELHPQAMERYDRLRVGVGDLAAATKVSPTITTTPAARGEGAGQDATRSAAPRLSPFQAARAAYAPMLTPDRGHAASSATALAAWEGASAWAGVERDAAKASARAQNRLRELHPQTMARFDQLRTGLGDLAAATQVAPAIAAAQRERAAQSPAASALPGQSAAAPAGAGRDGARGQQTSPASPPIAAGKDRGQGTATVEVWLAALAARGGDRQSIAAATEQAKSAEKSLRAAHPDALARYDALRKGLDPVAAMREVAPLIRHEITHPDARATFAQMLRPQGSSASAQVALAALVAAAPMRHHAHDAASAAERAEARLAVLHPQVMRDYDQVRTHASPAAALTFATDQLATRPGQAQPGQGAADAAATPPSLTKTAPGPAAAAHGAATNSETPSAQAQEDYGRVVAEVLPEKMATKVLTDSSWPALADQMHTVRASGRDVAGALAAAVAARELDSAQHPAKVLSHRLAATSETTPPGAQEAAREDPKATVAPQAAASGGPARPVQVAAASYPGAPTSSTQSATPAGAPARSRPAHVAAISYPAALTSAPAPTSTPSPAPAARHATAATTAPAGLHR